MDIPVTKENENERLQEFAKFVLMSIDGVDEGGGLHVDIAEDIINEALSYGLADLDDDNAVILRNISDE